jgi:hypothetical protein
VWTACPQAVEEHSDSSLSATSSNDAEFEAQVQRFLTLNAALKNIASKANTMSLAIAAQSESALTNIELLEATCELQFGEESFWTNSAITLRNFNQQVDGKMNSSLRQLVQRDVLEKIKQELDTNQQTKELIDFRRATKDLSKNAADQALAKLASIVYRRKMILAHCVTSLMSHQYNYYVRVADMARPLHQVAADCKKMLAEQGSSTPPQDSAQVASPSQSEQTTAIQPPLPQQALSAKQKTPPASPERAPARQAEQKQGTREEPEERPAPPAASPSQGQAPVEADLLGMFSDNTGDGGEGGRAGGAG